VKFNYYIFIISTFTLFACKTKEKTSENSTSMLKLYKLVNNELNYWETWDNDEKSAIIHWGIVGQRGQIKQVKSEFFSNFHKVVQKEIDEKFKEGYAEFDDDNVTFLEIVYKIDGFGTEKDLDKCHKLEQRLNELLGWTGLGHVDGSSIGSGTMEVGCIVVDFEIAKEIIVKDLINTEFADYSKIYKMEE